LLERRVPRAASSGTPLPCYRRYAVHWAGMRLPLPSRHPLPLTALIPLLVAVPLVLLAVWLVFLKPPAYDRWGLPTGSVGVEDVRKHPEAALAYPNATWGTSRVSAQVDHVLIEFGHPYHNPVANSAMTLFTPAPPAQVYAWYDRWLRAHGWRPGAPPPLSPPLLSQRLYERDAREEYSISVVKASTRPSRWQFDTRYSILPYGRTHGL